MVPKSKGKVPFTYAQLVELGILERTDDGTVPVQPRRKPGKPSNEGPYLNRDTGKESGAYHQKNPNNTAS